MMKNICPRKLRALLSADNYIKITKTSRATATRDLQELVDLKIFTRKGEGRWTGYFLKF